MAFITIVNVISEGSLKKLEVDFRFCVCTTICDKIKMSTQKTRKKKILHFLQFTLKVSFTKCFVTYVNRNLQKK